MPDNFAAVLLSIKPEHAQKIYSGQKKAELRKSFSNRTPNLIFLYETEPVFSITGAIVTSHMKKMATPDAVEYAAVLGIQKERAKKYFATRKSGWVLGISQAIRFAEPLSLNEARSLNHYFRVPQVFAFLEKDEALTQELMQRFNKYANKTISLRSIKKSSHFDFSELVFSEVGESYADIDSDFVNQLLVPAVGEAHAFSTARKRVMEVMWLKQVVGFLVLTEKTYGAIKSGPVLLKPEFRGLGLGAEIRKAIDSYALAHRFFKVYCTAAANKQFVISYLLKAGMKMEAKLRLHLDEGRDELVFGKMIFQKTTAAQKTRKPPSTGRSNSFASFSVRPGDKDFKAALNLFLENMKDWYFKPHRSLKRALEGSLEFQTLQGGNFSEKRRVLYLTKRAGKPVCAVLATLKRSSMLKLNVVSRFDDCDVYVATLKEIMKAHAYRRIYLTVPVSKPGVVKALNDLGFEFEGLLENPFGMGMNHSCFGWLAPS